MDRQADRRIGRRTGTQYSHSANVACMTTLSARNIRKSLDQGEGKGGTMETEKEEVNKTHREGKDEAEEQNIQMKVEKETWSNLDMKECKLKKMMVKMAMN